MLLNKLNLDYTCFALYENAFDSNIHMNRAFLNHIPCNISARKGILELVFVPVTH